LLIELSPNGGSNSSAAVETFENLVSRGCTTRPCTQGWHGRSISDWSFPRETVYTCLLQSTHTSSINSLQGRIVIDAQRCLAKIYSCIRTHKYNLEASLLELMQTSFDLLPPFAIHSASRTLEDSRDSMVDSRSINFEAVQKSILCEFSNKALS
jgi:hypothetical protein